MVRKAKKKLLWADGTKDYATLLVMHCDDVSHYKESGKFLLNKMNIFIKWGRVVTLLGNLHVHLEVGKGKFSKVVVASMASK